MTTIDMIKEARKASNAIPSLHRYQNEKILRAVASRLVERADYILSENAKDLSRMDPANPDFDRLKLTPERIQGIASDMDNVASLDVPYGNTIWRKTRPNGMSIRKVTVPFGVIGVIYEARPNVTADVFGLCFRAGSACVMKGGHDADNSSRAIVDIIREVLREFGLPEGICTLLPGDRQSASVMMGAVGLIDVIIPRGGRGLIDFVRDNSRVPVIETGAGVCHTYFEGTASTEMGKEIIFNAKTRRVSVCNALDCLIIDRSRMWALPGLCGPLAEMNVVIYADPEAHYVLEYHYPAELLRPLDEEHTGIEFRDYAMGVMVCENIDEALDIIARYGSHHSECIISEDKEAIERFQREVDAACVYANVSTAFTDGAQFGFGAEIGISTQKLHARGPMALPELVTYKYLIEGSGQTRQP